MNPILMIRDGRVLHLTLNCPDRRNVLDEPLCRLLLQHLAAADEDWSVGCVLLDAAGPFFSAGLDHEAHLHGEFFQVFERLMTHGFRSNRPIVAAVQGPCLDAGVGLVANAHVVVAAQGVQFGLTELRHGGWPFVSFPAIARAIGERRALALAAMGRVFSSAEALQFGLVHEVAPAFEIEDRAIAIARRLASASQDALRRGLEFTWECFGMDFDSASRFASRLMLETMQTPDYREGVRALREQRPPEWPSLKSG